MFAELGDAPRAMRIAGDQAVDLGRGPDHGHVTHPLPLSKYQKHLNGPRGSLTTSSARQGEVGDAGWQDRGAIVQAGVQGGRRCVYLRSHHQSANPAVPMTAVRAAETSNESAANLNQSVTVHNFQSAQLPRVRVLSRFFSEATALARSTLSQFFIGALTPAAARCGASTGRR
jgi:hypothetical protein